MHIITDVNKISKTIQRNLTFILMLFQNLAFILPSFQQLLLKRMSVFSHKMVFIKNEAALMCGNVQGHCSYNLVYNFLMQLFPLKSLVFMVHLLNAFWHGKEIFPKSSSQNEIIPLLIVVHLPFSKYKVVKICFYSCRYKIKIFNSCRTRVVRVALVSHSCRQSSTRVAFVSHSCRSYLALVFQYSKSTCRFFKICRKECGG